MNGNPYRNGFSRFVGTAGVALRNEAAAAKANCEPEAHVLASCPSGALLLALKSSPEREGVAVRAGADG